jgi:hypothetical protein
VSDVAESAVIRRRTIMAAQGKYRTAQPAPLRMPQQVAPIDRRIKPTGTTSDTPGIIANSYLLPGHPVDWDKVLNMVASRGR